MSRLTIDLDALAHNHAILTAASPSAQVAPVIKADGYGLGAGPVARRLWAQGARTFFIARLEEGEALRHELGARDAAIMVLDGLTPGSAGRLRAAGLTPVLNAIDQVAEWTGDDLVLHFDTGMNRMGLSAADARALAAAGVQPGLIMSHLGSAADPADPRNALQLARFKAITALFPAARASLAASSGIYLGPDYHFDMVRPGISLFGGGPREVPDPDFRAVATLTAPILQFRDLKGGDQAGYGSTFTAPHDMRLVILGCGYADGILRTAHKGGAVAYVKGRAAPFVFVTMDLIAVDVSSHPPLRIGDAVELLGDNAPLDDLAAAAGSVAHECLVRLGSRGVREFVGPDK